MIDLADIRRKAKEEKESSRREGSVSESADPSAEQKSQSSVQGIPEFSEKDLLDFSEDKAPGEGGDAGDPLERLFSEVTDLQLATDEIYFKGLAGGGEQVAEVRREWLTFSLGREEYALDIEGVVEIIKPRAVSQIPRVPEFILGIMSLRGVILPIFDLKQRLRLGRVDESPANRIIICQRGDLMAGLLVDGISQVVRISERNIEPPPALMPDLDVDLVEGVGRHQGSFLILLNLGGVLTAEISSR